MIGGLLLYLLTLIIEVISLICRFLLVAGLCSLIAGPRVGLFVGVAASVGPLAYSLLVLCGLPSGHMLVRYALGARVADAREQQRVAAALHGLLATNVKPPRHVFIVDAPNEINACVSGTTLYVYTGLLRTRFLRAVLAHELGHLNSLDGRLTLAMRALVVPGGFFIARFLIFALSLVFRVLAELLRLLCTIVGMSGALVLRIFGFVAGTVPFYIVIFAMGGIGPRLLDFAWERYFIRREYHADAFAVRLGQGKDNIEALSIFTLDDVEIPWSERKTHPPTRERIERLREAVFVHDRSPLPKRSAPRSFAFGLNWRSPTRASVSAIRWHVPWFVWASYIVTLMFVASATWFSASLREIPRLPDLTVNRPFLIRPTLGPTPTIGLPQMQP